MQLDKTLIVVRERGVFDTLDLALRVLRIYAWPLGVTMFLGTALWAVVNYLLTGWMLQTELDAPDSAEQVAIYVRYVWTMIILVYVEAPLASAVATVYLGQALFVDRPSIRDALRETLRFTPRLIWCHALLRGALIAVLLVYAIDRSSVYSGAEIYLLLLFLVLVLRRATAPFINEILLLERNPLRAAHPSTMTIRKRSLMLHGPATGNLLNLTIVCYLLAILLTGLSCGTMVLLQGVFLGSNEIGPGLQYVGFPLALWLTATFLTVVRFLSYLDLRIRFEGWEVELRMRAEASRIAGARP